MDAMLFVRWEVSGVHPPRNEKEQGCPPGLDTRKEKTLVKDCPTYPSSLSFSPDGSRLILTLEDAIAAGPWGTELYVIPAHKGGLVDIGWNSDELMGVTRIEIRRPQQATGAVAA